MPTFEYQAEKTDGTVVRGVVVSSSLDGAAQELDKQGLTLRQIGPAKSSGDPIPTSFVPRSVETPSGAAALTGPYDYSRTAVKEGSARAEGLDERTYVQTSVMGPLIGQVPLANLAFFFRQLATMLRAGVGMVQSLNTLASQARNAKLSVVLREMARQVEMGQPMSVILSRYPEVFTSVTVSVVKSGEEGGFLDEALGTVADYLDQEIELRNLYRKTTFWPKLELGASIVIILAANAIIGSLNDKAQKLQSPLTTPATWIWLGPLILALFLFFRVGLANPGVKSNWDAMTSYIPYLGNTLRQIAMAKFGRAFAALYRSGVPLQKALQLSADACGNEYLRGKMYPAYRDLENGRGITDTIESTQAFSPIVVDMIRTGETTGNLDQMLSRTAEFYIEEAKVRQQKLGLVVGITVALFVCIYIGYIIINFYMGYFGGITQAVNSA
ncbi:MAG TPA: type II secretion system F family protein [Fimbriimonas sp.]|nr:type II secretion system F family protein [Fimbriimonas sp.]